MERLQEVLKTKTEETASATSVDDLEEDLLNVIHHNIVHTYI